MVDSQRSSYVLARTINGSHCHQAGDIYRDKKKSAVLSDDSMCLWSWGGKLFRRMKEEVEGGGDLNGSVEPERECRYQKHSSSQA